MKKNNTVTHVIFIKRHALVIYGFDKINEDLMTSVTVLRTLVPYFLYI